MLSRHVNSQKVLEQAREHSARHRHGKPTVHEMLDREAPGTISRHPASKDYGTEPIPKYAIPSHGVPAAEAYELVNNELSLDGNPLCVPSPSFFASLLKQVLTSGPPSLQPQPRCESRPRTKWSAEPGAGAVGTRSPVGLPFERHGADPLITGTSHLCTRPWIAMRTSS